MEPVNGAASPLQTTLENSIISTGALVSEFMTSMFQNVLHNSQQMWQEAQNE
jgi:hypothetical protein